MDNKILNRRKDLEQIFLSGVERVNPEKMILSRVKRQGNVLHITLDDETLTYNLNDYKQIFVIGAGKGHRSHGIRS